MTEEIGLRVGDLIPVEIAGESIGDAVVSEITDDYMEVTFYGHAIKLSTEAVKFHELRQQINSWGL